MTTPARYTREQLSQVRIFRTVRRAGLAGDLAGNFNIFNIANSPVEVFNLYGIVTTGLNAAAIVCRLQYTCALAGSLLTPLSGLHATMISDCIGTIYSWTGLFNGPLLDNNAIVATSNEGYRDLTVATCTPWSGNHITLLPGIISVTNTVAGTGIVDWHIVYLPLLDTGIITAL